MKLYLETATVPGWPVVPSCENHRSNLDSLRLLYLFQLEGHFLVCLAAE